MLHFGCLNDLTGSGPQRDRLESFLRLRHRVFVEEQGWEALRREDGREIDQFDLPTTLYGLWVGENEREVLGGFRLLPTDGPHMLNTLFKDLVGDKLMRSAKIYEASRIVVDTALRGGARHVSKGMSIALADLCVALGMEGLSFVTDVNILPGMMASGWIMYPLGEPAVTPEGDTIVAGYSPTDADLPARLRGRLGWEGDTLAPGCLDDFRAGLSGQARPGQKAAVA